ncbi:MAG: GDSL-type esterase/lipase family protein [Candidatus Latescibacterota bacterium]|nr:GDSL-type esterase/lipase family protein [Candidatus Latescibacterota bacterium]
MSRLDRKTLYTALLALMSFACALVLGEIVLRAIDFEFRLFPTRIEFGWPDPVLLENNYKADRELLWAPKQYYTQLESLRDTKPSIVFMGDSCTAWGLYDQLFDELVDGRNPNHNFSYLNTAVAGWSSYQGLKQFERDIIPLAPKAVALYFGWNDHWANFGLDDKAVGQFNRDRWQSAIKLSELRLVQFFNFFAVELYGAEEIAQHPARVSPADFAANLKEIIHLARQNDIVPILLTAPTSHTAGAEPEYLAERWLNDLDKLVPLHRRYAEFVRQVARDEEVLLVDLLTAFDRLPPDEVKTKYFESDGIHLTGEGHKVIALVLYKYFARSGLLEQIIR